MIDIALTFIKDQLNAFFLAADGAGDSIEAAVTFIDGQKMDPLVFKSGAVSMLLINVEEENVLRPPNVYRRSNGMGVNKQTQHVNPDVRLNLYILLVAKYNDYQDSLKALSLVVRYFQQNRIFSSENSDALDPAIEKLQLELITLPFAEQNEIWNALRVTYHPSLLYKVKMVVFEDAGPVLLGPVQTADINVVDKLKSDP